SVVDRPAVLPARFCSVPTWLAPSRVRSASRVLRSEVINIVAACQRLFQPFQCDGHPCFEIGDECGGLDRFVQRGAVRIAGGRWCSRWSDGKYGPDRGRSGGATVDDELAADALNPFAHAAQADTPGRRAGRVEAGSVVGDLDGQRTVRAVEPDVDAAGMSVFDAV